MITGDYSKEKRIANTILTQNRLKERLDYNADTGEFTWRVSCGRVKAGQTAGTTRVNGYWRIGLDGAEYSAHRLAWLYTFNQWPEDQIDHIDRNPSNNRISNLRAVTKSQNKQNCEKYRNNNSGYKGVGYHKSAGRWRARIDANGKRKFLGYFDSPEEASNAYQNAATALHTHRPMEADIAKTAL